jgi:hypothetical protein
LSLAALIVAVVAVVVALAGFAWSIVWSIWQHRQVTQSRLHVRAAFAVVIGPLVPKPVLAVTATNAGMVPLTLSTVVAEVKGATEHLALIMWQFQTPGPLPQKLGPGETWNGHFDPESFREAVAKVTPKGPPWKVTIRACDTADRLHDAPVLKVKAA